MASISKWCICRPFAEVAWPYPRTEADWTNRRKVDTLDQVAAYPPGLCQFIADLCLAASHAIGRGQNDTVSKPPGTFLGKGGVDSKPSVTSGGVDSKPSVSSGGQGDADASKPSVAHGGHVHGDVSDSEGFDVAACGNGDQLHQR